MCIRSRLLARASTIAALIGWVFAFPVIADDMAMLVIEHVTVRTLKEDGKPWDFGGGAPDLRVSVERVSKPEGEMHITAPRENTFKATFNRRVLGVDEGDVIEIRVLDEDSLAKDDEAGKTSQKITARMLRSGEVKLAFDQVDELILRFEKSQ